MAAAWGRTGGRKARGNPGPMHSARLHNQPSYDEGPPPPSPALDRAAAPAASEYDSEADGVTSSGEEEAEEDADWGADQLGRQSDRSGRSQPRVASASVGGTGRITATLQVGGASHSSGGDQAAGSSRQAADGNRIRVRLRQH